MVKFKNKILNQNSVLLKKMNKLIKKLDFYGAVQYNRGYKRNNNFFIFNFKEY